MNNLLVRYRIRTNRDGTVLAGNYINVYWDDVAEAFVVHHFDDENDTTGTVLTSGPDLGADRFDHEPVTQVAPIPYSFCDGADLQSFTKKSTFPYATKVSSPSHFACVSSVCDLQISDVFTIQQASDYVTPDGAFEVTATSSNGTIKYSLDPSFDYGTQGQTSGLFGGQYAGTYTVTAKDALGCIDQITLTIPVPTDYGVLYRADYTDVNGIASRVDILERGYTGSVIEVDCGPNPFILRTDQRTELDKFTSIVPSEGVLTLWSPSNFYFQNVLSSQDERKYQMRFYKNYGVINPAFTPAVMDTLDLWTNIAGSGSDWTPGAIPTVTVPGGGSSDLYHTAYAFEAGKTYEFDYTITKTSTQNLPVISISCVNASYQVLEAKYVTINTGLSSSGTFSFVAPTGATGIAIAAELTSRDDTYSITAFTNETASEAGGAAGLEIKWLGYVISQNNSEPYIKAPYEVTITASDGLADLANYDFLDKDDNKYREDIITIKAISEILAKTDLDINIQAVINRYEINMNQAANNDPLNQCTFHPDTFYHGGQVKNCFDVLTEILKPFGGVIKQRLGKWFIAHPEELVTTANYREFNSEGILITSGTVEDIVDIDTATQAERAVMEGGSQMLQLLPAYGKLFFEHTLLKHSSLIYSYSFEPEDLYTDANGLKLFKNWNVNIINAPGATYGIKETKAFEGDYNLYLKYPLFRGGGGDHVAAGTSVLSTPITIEYENTDAFEFRFNYAALLSDGAYGRVYWIKYKWMFKVGSYYYNETGGWTTDVNQKYNDLIIERFNEVLEKKVTALLRDVPILTSEIAQVEFILTNAFVYDFADTAALKDTPTTTKAIGTKMKVSGSSTTMLDYELVEGTDAESLPDVVRPDDYTGTINERIWVLEQSASSRGREVEFNYLDNVVLLHFPDGAEPPEDVTIQRDNNAGIKIDFEKAYLLNDIDLDNINNSEYTYKNYFKLLDGTPTQTWARTYRVGEGKLLELLSNDVVSQYKTPSNKITGSFLIDKEVLPSSILKEVNDNDRKYMFMGYELNDKHATISFDIVEIKDTITDDESDDIDAGFTTGFSLGFRS